MGIQNRDYMRGGRGQFVALFQHVVPTLIAINLAVFFVWQFAHSGALASFMIDNFLGSWSAVKSGRVWTLWTAAFSHKDLMHIFFNMWVLYMFGTAMEERWGSRRFLVFYLLAAGFSSLVGILLGIAIVGLDLRGLGASGAVVGVTMAYGLAFPKRTILLFFFLPVPALAAALLFVGYDLLGFIRMAQHVEFGVGHGVHLGGALFGALYHFYLIGKLPIPGLGGVGKSRRRSSRRRARVDVLPGVHNSYHSPDPDEARMDLLLGKIQRGGLDSLTPEERDFMVKMSQRLRRDS